MLSVSALVLSAFLAVTWSAEDLTFPPGFKFGVASAAYQVEGAWNVSDKGEGTWDRFTHRIPSPIESNHTGDVACDSYHLWKEDVEMLTEVGVDFYRLSISWPRLLPTGYPDHISEDGKKYYNNLIDGLLEKGIAPVVTIYHFDLPQTLQDLGGWANPLIASWFADYARVVYTLYGDRVKTWITINEPWVICDLSYMYGLFPPTVVNPVGMFICTKNVLMAHAKAWRIYDEEFRPKYNGEVSLANQVIWMQAASESDELTTQHMRDFQEGRFAHAIFSEKGGWPPALEEAIADFSRKEGYPWSMLPTLTKEEIKFIKGTYDFYGINFYISRRVRKGKEGEVTSTISLNNSPLFNAKLDLHPDWPVIMKFFTSYPEGLRKQLAYMKKQYGDIPILITENGLATAGGLDDQDRVDYIRNHMKQVLLSIKEDGVNVTGYTVWTIMDNLEWLAGYNIKFGLYEVDFTSPQRTRTPRASAKYYASIIMSHSLDVPYNFTSNVAPKSSKPQDNNTNYIIFRGLILVVVVGVIAAIVACRVKRRARLEKKHRYTAVKNGAQNGDHNGTQNGTQNGGHNDTQNSGQNDTQNGSHNGVQNGTQNGNHNGTRNGVDESKVLLTN